MLGQTQAGERTGSSGSYRAEDKLYLGDGAATFHLPTNTEVLVCPSAPEDPQTRASFQELWFALSPADQASHFVHPGTKS